MSVETATYISQLNAAWPLNADLIAEGDDHIRVTKTVLKTSFPNFSGAWNATHVEANYLVGVTSSIQTQLNAKANTASPTLTGTVVLPSTTSIGTVSSTEIGYIDGLTSPVQTQIDGKVSKSGDTYTGTHDLTGATVTVPTQSVGDATAKAASTAFVSATAFSAALPGQTSNGGKFPRTNGTNTSWQWCGLPVVLRGSSGTIQLGYINVITTNGITLTVPTGASIDDRFAIANASGGFTSAVAWGSEKLKAQSPGSMTINSVNAFFEVAHTGNATYGWV